MDKNQNVGGPTLNKNSEKMPKVNQVSSYPKLSLSDRHLSNQPSKGSTD